jgi:hypothetical protein
MKAISVLINVIHIVYMFAPFILLFIPKMLLIKVLLPLKLLFLVYLLTPLHWPFLENKCILTVASVKTGDFKGEDQSWAFTDKYLRPVYEPLLNMVGLKWNLKNKTKMTYAHWILIFIIVWYVLCFRLN